MKVILSILQIWLALCSKLYVYDQEPVAELDTEGIREATIFITENDGVYTARIDPATKVMEPATLLTGTATVGGKVLDSTDSLTQFGLPTIKPSENVNINPYILSEGAPPTMMVIEENKAPCSSPAEGAKAKQSKAENTSGKAIKKKSKNAAGTLSLASWLAVMLMVCIQN